MSTQLKAVCDAFMECGVMGFCEHWSMSEEVQTLSKISFLIWGVSYSLLFLLRLILLLNSWLP